MGEKISTEKKLQYQAIQKDFKSKIPEIMIKIQRLEKENKEEQDNDIFNYRNFAVANFYLDAVEAYCNMTKAYHELYNKINETDLKEARELYFKALVSIEKIVGKFVASGLTENAEIIEALERFNPKRKLFLIKKFENKLSLLEECYHDLPKYKWSLVEMEGRYITIAKNMMNFKELQVQDPRVPYYAENYTLLNLIKAYLRKASERYRDKYMQTNKEPMDMKKAILYQEALKSICMVLGTSQETENSKKIIDAWNTILDNEEKYKEKKLKFARLNKNKSKKK